MVQAQPAPENQPVHPAAVAARLRPEERRRIGIHTSIAGGLTRALELAVRLHCTTLQIFSASPRMWVDGARRIGPESAGEFRLRRQAIGLHPVVVHANYLINLAGPDRRLRSLSIRAFRGELARAAELAADYLVVHPGSRRDSAIGSAVKRIADSLGRAARGLDLGGLRILIENTAGQGTAVGSTAEELRAILDACPQLHLGACLDTAHLLAAGYDVISPGGLDETVERFDRLIGFHRVPVIHLNDSKAPLGARVDRHEHLGRGHIGFEALGRIVNHPRLAGRAFILETPIDRPGDDWRNVRALWKLAGISWKRRAGGGDGFRPRPRPRRAQR
ncbi:MAG TPA: deoxyribonuclease IV [Candidatus Acidoferrales bacterium]|nr:deoxyribonuclease IV [Candidatus Acidoferrales bacterium]